MIYGKLADFESLVPGACSPAVQAALRWIRSLPAAPELGRYELNAIPGMYAMVMRYDTVPAESSRFESHRRAVDLQYTLAGAEGIEWAHSADLTPDGGYDQDKDIQFYQAGHHCGFVEKRPGYFSIYALTDAHRPKIQIPGATEVFKLVVKIPVTAFA